MRIEHVALYVNDLEKTKKIFMEYLGAKSNDGYHNQKTGFCSYFLTFDDGARIEIMHIPKLADLPKKLARTGYSHIAFSVGSMEKVDALTAELKADGYEVISGPRTTGNIINLRLDITHLYYPAKNSFQKGRLKRREIFTELLLYTLTT
ncbi:MAG: VOC family protein [Blautia faecis]